MKPPDLPKVRSGGFAVAAVVLVLASVLFFLPGAFTRWFLPKELLALVAVLLATRVVPTGRLPRVFWIVVLTAGGIMFLAALQGAAPINQIMGRWPRFEGLVSLPVYIAAAWAGARLLGPAQPLAHVYLLTRTVSAAALILAFVTCLEVLGFQPISTDLARAGALLGNATDQGIVAAVFATLISLPLYREFANRANAATARPKATGWELALLGGGFTGALLTVMFSGSRAGLVALAIGLGGVAIWLLVDAWKREGKRAARLPLTIGSGLALVVLGALVAVPEMRTRVLGVSEFAQRTIDDRLLVWSETVAILAERPLLGVGPSGYLDAIATRHGAQWYAQVDSGTVLDSPHNWLLQAGMAGGIPLIILALTFCMVMMVSFARALRVNREKPGGLGIEPGQVKKPTEKARARAVLEAARVELCMLGRRDLIVVAGASLVALGTALLTHFTGAATGILGGLLVGIVIAVAPRADHAAWRGIRTGLVALWVIFFALSLSADFSLQRGLTVSTALQADHEFSTAAALRPWDGDLASIAAQSLTARADRGDPEAAEAAIRWARTSLLLLPGNVATRTAEGVALRLAGQYQPSVDALQNLSADVPLDADVAIQYAISLASAGSVDAARSELQRAAALRPGDLGIMNLLEQLP